MANTERLFELYHEAKALTAGAPREEFLAARCCDDARLRARVSALLQADESAGDFLERTELVHASGDLEENPDSLIGHYKLIEKIGEGGCGVVYLAEQKEPVRRQVALKIIKPGMDTHEVIARFEQERQALAILDHPNIAKVFDAGATEHGRPFFVMELVRGIRITEYCDQSNLSTASRLELFIAVCQAVQHAHQKGIIHRDLKPSNILVTQINDIPVPKVIDFGVAKATAGRLTEASIHTLFEQMIGTPLYMSPEQAGMGGLDVDTRTDIYALGVLLYELLTGRMPFDADALMKAGYDEMRRIIREEEPQTPSMSLRTMAAETRANVARHRNSDPLALTKLVHGDLDWIVMKALEKDRSRRYESATSLAHDIERHLANEPVHARPASQFYRFGRLVRRNRVLFAAAGAVALALMAGLGIAIDSLSKERKAREGEIEQRKIAQAETQKVRVQTAVAEKHAQAETAARQEAEAVSTFLTEIFQSPDPVHNGRTVTVAETLDRAVRKLDTDLASQPARRAKLQETLAWTYRALGLYREALPIFKVVWEYKLAALGPEHPDTLNGMHNVAISYAAVGNRDEALKLMEAVLPLRIKVNGPEHSDTLSAMHNLSVSYSGAGRHLEALKLSEQVLVLREKVNGSEHPDTIRAMGNLAECYYRVGRREEALEKRKEVLALDQKFRGAEHPETLAAMALLALSNKEIGHPEEAIQMGEKALALHVKVHGPEYPDTLSVMHNLATSYKYVGRRDEALSLQERVLPLRLKVNGAGHPDTIGAIQNLFGSYSEVAALQAWFGQDAKHASTCGRLLEMASGSNDASFANRAAKACCLRALSDPQMNETALTLVRRAVELDKGHGNLPWDEMVLGMAEYRNGNYQAADQALTAAEKSSKDNRLIRYPSRYFHAMSLFRQGKEAEARQLFGDGGAHLKPLPADERQPLADGAGFDDLTVWLCYKEAKALLQPPDQ
jgi:serine/threonine protein kinase